MPLKRYLADSPSADGGLHEQGLPKIGVSRNKNSASVLTTTAPGKSASACASFELFRLHDKSPRSLSAKALFPLFYPQRFVCIRVATTASPAVRCRSCRATRCADCLGDWGRIPYWNTRVQSSTSHLRTAFRLMASTAGCSFCPASARMIGSRHRKRNCARAASTTTPRPRRKSRRTISGVVGHAEI